jgi:hypothetical protein
MPDAAEYRDVPFREAIDFFRQKVNVASPVWADILGGAHARAFTVAVATKDGMLEDFRAAIDDAIANGTTIADFRKKFDAIVTRYGWDYKGGRGWRTRVIYQTNLSTAYSAGRYRQMTDPDVLRYQPYWRYRHADGVKHPRPQHLAWDGMVLLATDPWWKSHYPPNGWGCHCYVEPISERELRDMGKIGPDKAPPINYRSVLLNTSAGPLPIQVPEGIDPGWGYNVGDAAWGARGQAELLKAAEANAGNWERLTPGDWRSYGRPARLPAVAAKAAPIGAASSAAALQGLIETAIGGEEKALALPDGSTVYIDAASLAAHLAAAPDGLGRARFIPLLPELLAAPQEIWIAFDRNTVSGKVSLRKRIVKVLDIGPYGVTLVAEAQGGMLSAVTFFPTRDPGAMGTVRTGRLLWAD